jgi:hypothetical protein
MTISFGDKGFVYTDVFSIILSHLEPNDFMQASSVCKSWRNHVYTSGCQDTFLRNAGRKYRHLNLIDLIKHMADLRSVTPLERLVNTIKCFQKLTKVDEKCLNNRINFILSEKFPSPFDITKYDFSKCQDSIKLENESFKYWVENEEPYKQRKKLKHQHDVNARDFTDATPLIVKAWSGQWRQCQVLIKNGAKVNVRNRYGETPLTLSIYCGSLKTVHVLLKAGAQVNWSNNDGDITEAILDSQYDIAMLLIDYVKSTSTVSANLFNLLDDSQDELIERLIEKGMKFDETRDGKTLLYEACKQNSLKVVRALIKAGANKIDFNMSALDYARKYWPDDVELIQHLRTKRRKKVAKD